MNDILEFWFDSPAADSAALLAKVVRWFQSGSELDPIVTERFAGLVIDALVGRLDSWAETPRGRLALILLLDQLTRHVFRGTRRMYSGDRMARALTLEGLERGDDRELGLEERMFFIMPLAHSERAEDQMRSVAYAQQLAREAPPVLRAGFEDGVDHATQYRMIIDRFGRFPHRNAVLGRASTPEEIDFLDRRAAAA